MFRQFLHISFSLLLIIATSGIVVSKHYCSGELFDVSVSVSLDNCCNDICDDCRNEKLFLQLYDDFLIVHGIDDVFLSFLDIGKEIKVKIFFLFNEIVVYDYNINGPPPDGVDLFISKSQQYLC